MSEIFFKFPSTPYLIASENQLLRSDKLMREDDRKAFITQKIIVEEKIDGANLGISFDAEGNIKLQNRGNYLLAPFVGQWKKLTQWLGNRENILFDILSSDYILFGEWCYASHSVKYEKLIDWFLAFDIYDKNKQKFLSTPKRNLLLKKMNIEVVPKIQEGIFTLDDLQCLMDQQSSFSSNKIEGIYLRIEDDNWLEKRAKMVRSEFIQKIQEHWSHKPLEVNNLALS